MTDDLQHLFFPCLCPMASSMRIRCLEHAAKFFPAGDPVRPANGAPAYDTLR